MHVKLKTLRSALIESDDRPPFISGTCSLPEGDLTLFYGKPGKSDRIDLTKAVSNAALKQLSDACGAATFGVNQQTVLDESYRKARKMDVADFAAKFDLHRSGILNKIRSQLLRGHHENEQIEAELYKLNIYGENSFFKAHKDTPRGETMFGSLVIVYPTAHEGGSLIFRHWLEEWEFDSAKEVSKQSKPSVGYAAFYGDVEHEITMVTSGYRVTLTYNLYFASEAPKTYVAESLAEIPFATALRALLDDPEFLPEGGNLGLPLHHQYATKDALNPIVGNLKGIDAVVENVCKNLSLEAYVRAAFKGLPSEDEPPLLLSDTVPEFDLEDLDDYTETTSIMKQEGATVALPGGEGPARFGQIEIWWIKDVQPDSAQQFRAPYVAYGNEPMVEYLYGDCCLVISVGPPGDRSTL